MVIKTINQNPDEKKNTKLFCNETDENPLVWTILFHNETDENSLLKKKNVRPSI